jgi:glycolate oxidase FAD binding subunit
VDVSKTMIDGLSVSISEPASIAELCEIVRRVGSEKQAVYPMGGRTMLHIGLPPTKPGIGVDLRKLDQVIDYPARDMTITVQAGITLAQLQEILRKEHQQLPVDVPFPEQATLGGSLAVNVSGSRRFGQGTLRDYLIGMSAVNDEAQEIKAGGRVVKNVAGYDMCKLFIGSLGTLGILTQATLKLRPLPEDRSAVLVPCTVESVGPLLEQLHRSRTRPVAVDLLNRAAIDRANRVQPDSLPEAPAVVAVLFEEKAETVRWQVRQLRDELGSVAVLGPEVRQGADADRVLAALTAIPAWPDAQLTFKANLVPQAVAALFQKANGMPDRLLLQAHAGNGIVFGHAPGDLTLDRARQMLAPLQETATEAHGNLVVHRCPTDWKKSLPIWGAPRGDTWLMRAIKDKLDPRQLFNPGRFIDGI